MEDGVDSKASEVDYCAKFLIFNAWEWRTIVFIVPCAVGDIDDLFLLLSKVVLCKAAAMKRKTKHFTHRHSMVIDIVGLQEVLVKFDEDGCTHNVHSARRRYILS